MVGAGGADKGGGGRRRDTQNLDYVLRSMLAGGLAGSAAKTAVAPLDRVKILFQTNNKRYNRHAGTFLGVFRAVGEIGRESGVRGLFQGNSATLMRIFPYAAIKFMAYEQFKTILMPTKSKETPLRGFAAGSLAGLTTVLVTYPLELIRVRLAFDTTHAKSPGVIGTMREIWNESRLPAAPSASGKSSAAKPTAVQQNAGAGVAAHLTKPAPAVTAGRSAGSPVLPAEGGSFVQRLPASFHRHFPLVNFYRGFMPTVLGILPYAGSSFVIYSHLTKLCASWLGLASEKELRGWWTLASGGAAGAAAQTVAYPAEVVRRRMQVSGALDPHRFVRISDTCRDVLRERGPRGFFVGLSIGYLKVAPMSAISFLVYEEMKVLLKIS